MEVLWSGFEVGQSLANRISPEISYDVDSHLIRNLLPICFNSPSADTKMGGDLHCPFAPGQELKHLTLLRR